MKHQGQEKLIVISFGPYAREGQTYFSVPENPVDLKKLLEFEEGVHFRNTTIHKIDLDELHKQLSMIQPVSQEAQDAVAVCIEILERKN